MGVNSTAGLLICTVNTARRGTGAKSGITETNGKQNNLAQGGALHQTTNKKGRAAQTR